MDEIASDSSLSDEDEVQVHQSNAVGEMTEIDLAITAGAAELQMLRDRRAKALRRTQASAASSGGVRGNIQSASTGASGNILAQTLRRTIGCRATTAHRQDRTADTRLHKAVNSGDAVAVVRLLKGSAHRQLNVRQGGDALTPLHVVRIQFFSTCPSPSPTLPN